MEAPWQTYKQQGYSWMKETNVSIVMKNVWCHAQAWGQMGGQIKKEENLQKYNIYRYYLRLLRTTTEIAANRLVFSEFMSQLFCPLKYDLQAILIIK